MEGMSAEPSGDASFASQHTEHAYDAAGLWGQLPPCPPWPDLN